MEVIFVWLFVYACEWAQASVRKRVQETDSDEEQWTEKSAQETDGDQEQWTENTFNWTYRKPRSLCI